MLKRQKRFNCAGYRYGVCGLSLISNVPLRLVRLANGDNGTPDIRFTLTSSSTLGVDRFANKSPSGVIKNGAGHPSITVYRVDEHYLLDCHNTAKRVRFLMSRAEGWIKCYPETKTNIEDIEVWLFGLVLAFFLQERGIFSLHAAAVNCAGRAIAFIGNNGYGKSTLASFFLQQGHSLITDDILPLNQDSAAFHAMPVCPAMNLWPQTLANIRKPDEPGNNGSNAGCKQRYSLRNLKLPFAQFQAPLAAIYFLRPKTADWPNPVKITPVPKARALIDLLSNTRANSMIDSCQQQKLFNTYAALVSRVSICELEYGRGFERLPTVYDAIVRAPNHLN
jgi:hypothetical protein